VPAPSPASALSRVEQKLDRLERRLAFLDQLPAVLEAGAASADDLARTHQLHERMENALSLVEKLTRPETLAKLEQLLELANAAPDHLAGMLGMLDDLATQAQQQGVDLGTVVPDLAETVLSTLRAIQSARTNIDQPGLFAVLGALRDPDVSRAFGFGLEFARTLGKDLQPNASALPAGSTPQ
jgi:uncharacterized protein YjgD (DUF1641 family)